MHFKPYTNQWSVFATQIRSVRFALDLCSVQFVLASNIEKGQDRRTWRFCIKVWLVPSYYLLFEHFHQPRWFAVHSIYLWILSFYCTVTNLVTKARSIRPLKPPHPICSHDPSTCPLSSHLETHRQCAAMHIPFPGEPWQTLSPDALLLTETGKFLIARHGVLW